MWSPLTPLPADPIFALDAKYKADDRDNKVYLAVGLYMDEQAQPVVFSAMQNAAKLVQHENHNYIPMQGHIGFLAQVANHLLPGVDHNNIALQQTVGGTQACGLYADLMHSAREGNRIFLGVPTWGNHIPLLQPHELVTFSHWNPNGEASLQNYLEALEDMNPKDTLLIHGGRTHNPTGQNFTIEALDQLIPAIKEKGINVFIDFAYWGYGESWEADRDWVKKLWDNLDDVAIGLSFSKCATMYRHRLGTLLIKSKDAAQKHTIESNLQALVRSAISMPGSFGAELMYEVFTSKDLFAEWQQNITDARNSINKRRNWLVEALPQSLTPNWENARGMFAITNLTENQVLKIRKDHGIYMPRSGRVNFAGLKEADVEILKSVLS